MTRWKRYITEKFSSLFKKSKSNINYRVAITIPTATGNDFYILTYEKYKEIFDNIFGDVTEFGEFIEFEVYKDTENDLRLLDVNSFDAFLKFLFQHYEVLTLMKMRVDVTKV